MNRQSPISYIRKQKKVMATLSLWVASIQVFGQAAFIEDPYKTAIEGKHASLTNDKYNFTKDITNDKFSNDRSLNEDLSQTFSNEENLIEKLIEIPVKPTLVNTINDPETNVQGIIGKSETFPIDDPRDNVFPISLAELPATNQEVYLIYELYGVADAAGASVTINDSYARGGYLFKKSDSWTTQKEKINPEELSKGINFIRFSTLESAGYQYMVKNVQLVVEDVDGLDQKEPFSINQTELKSYDGKLYISGFADQNFGAININGVEITVKKGVFEAVIQDVKDELKISQGENELILPVTDQKEIQPDKIFELSNTNSFVQKQFFPLAENYLSHDGAALKVPVNSIVAETTFYMSALRYQDLSVVSAEMVNVTGNHSGYRLLPHGEHFVNSSATLEIPYDETKIPAGYKPQDIKTFYFDTNQRKWVALERDTILQDKKIIVSKTTHFTDFINGIIKVPESPETGSFTPTSIKDVKAADPAAGVVSIPPPTPNNMGSATTSFPIKLPAGRGGMQPSLSVNYNSEGGNGWMGIGWDISVPSISIDTRWGAPRYDNSSGPDLNCPGYETEIYSMSGEMLVLETDHEFTNPHRTSEICRMEDREFFLRKENGSYLQIKRHGSSPQNYWWEVTDKMGNKSFYGGYDDAVVNNAVIKTPEGNIAHWALYKTEDTNGNYVEYRYEHDEFSNGTNGAGDGGTEFYLSEIHYTKNDSNLGDAYYKIQFKTDGGGNRDDVQINARLGLVQVTSHLLDEIEIFLVEGGDNIPIRSYQFDYENPNFSKKQLTKISEYDANDQLFYSNTLEYWSEVTDDDFIDSTKNEEWSGIDDGIDGDLALSQISSDEFTNEGSMLGFSTGWGANGGVSVGVGTGFNIASKTLTAGASFDYSYSQNNGVISFTDINGDNLPDKVMRKNNSLTYRKNLGDLGGEGGFGPEHDILGIDRFSESTSNSTSLGFESNFFVFIGYTKNKSKNITRTYFSDVNGDGLVDLVNNGTVIFNIGPTNNDVNYSEINLLSPNAIEGGDALDQTAIDELNEEIEEEFQANNPLHDVVKVWIAPAPGDYEINPFTVSLSPLSLPNEEDEYLLDYDGVRVSIELGNANSTGTAGEIWGEILDPVDVNGNVDFDISVTKSTAITLNGLKKGQRVYFRVNSRAEGSYDRVEWTPSIEFLETPNRVDANGLSYYTSDADEGFVMSGNSFVSIPEGSTATINWNVSDPQYTITAGQFSDDLIYKVIIGEFDEETGEFNPSKVYSQSVSQSALSTSIIDPADFKDGVLLNPSLSGHTVQSGKSIKFEVYSTSNVDWKTIKWEPVVTITNAENESTLTNGLVNYSIYKNIIANEPGPGGGVNGDPIYSGQSGIPPTSYVRVDPSKSVIVTIDHMGNTDWAPNEFDGNLNDTYPLTEDVCYPARLIVKNNNKKVIKRQTFYLKASDEGQFYDRIYKTDACSDLNSSYYFGDSFDVTIPVSSDPNLQLTAPLYVEFHTDSINLAYQELIFGTVKQGSGIPQEIATVSNIYALYPSGKFGTEYRNWGQFSYNSTAAPGEIVEDNLKLYQPGEDMPEGNPFEDCHPEELSPEDYEACMQEQFDLLGIDNPQETKFIIMSPNENMKLADETLVPDVWEGYDEGIFVEGDAFSSSRLGVNNINTVLIQIPESGASLIPGIPLVSKGEGNSYAGNFGPVGGSISDGKNYLLNQYMDMNGDRYPDLLNRNTVQYTSPRGDLTETKDLGFGDVIAGVSDSWGASVSGTLKVANTPAIDQKYQKSQMAQRGEKVSADSPVQLPSSGSASLSAADNTSSEKLLWIDMNGDGLPDRVDLSESMTVRLNLGYSLGEPQKWANSPGEMSSASKTYSGGVGFSMFFNSISGGISGSATDGYTQQNFADINGDGLPDLLTDEEGGDIIYRLNTGSGFETTTHTINNSFINTNRSIGEGANIAFTVGFTVILVKFTITPRIGINRSVSRSEHTVSDINGDGYPDLLSTGAEGNDGDLAVRLNKTGKTHLLKQVNTPLGGYWKIDYERDGNTYEMPQSKWVMNSIIVNDGFTGDNQFTPDETKVSVKYYDGKYDRREREFMGYRAVQVNQLDVENGDDIYRFSMQEFHNNSYYLKGAVKKESLYDGSVLETDGSFDFYASHIPWASTETNYVVMARGVNDPGNPVFDANDDFTINDFGLPRDKSSLFVSPIKTIKKFTEGGESPLYTYTEIKSFDENGNITEFVDYGNGVDYNDEVLTDSDTSDNVRSVIEYNDPFVGLPTNIKVYENTSTLKRERIASYDNQANLEYVETKLTDSEYAKVSFQYDADYGNLTRVTHEESVDENSNQFFYEYTYDDVVHTYPVRVEDAFGYGSNNTYDYRFGVLVYSEDMNYQPMRTRIDDRGRVVEITGPYELFVEGLTSSDPAWTIRFEYENERSVGNMIIQQELEFTDYVVDANGSFEPGDASTIFDPAGLHHAITRHFDPEFRQDPETPDTENEIYAITLIDGLGKPIQVKKSTSIMDMATTTSGEPTENDIDLANTEYWLVNGKVITDAFGRALETYYPIVETYTDPFSTNSPALQYNGTPYEAGEQVFTKAEYDILDRVVEITLPGETNSMLTVYSIENSLFKTQVTNEKGQVKQSFTDIRGRTTKVVEDPGGKNIVTQFKYNAIGELLEVWDTATPPNKTISTYDLAGRRIELRHPDNGITKFTYDNASNLKVKETSNLLEIGESDKIEYSYTFNRLDSISYPLHPHNNVHFFYGQAEDASAADDFTVGRLWYQIDASGVQQFKYGRLGEVTYNLRSVAVPGDKAYWFQTKWEYDTWNRVKKITYPDEEEVTYFYNRGGELHAITSKKEAQQNEDIISQLGYDKFGQRTYLRYGNGTETEYTYEAERRRLELMTVSNSNRTFINNAYEYDILSNVTGIINTPDALSAGEIGGSVTYEYGYDNLNRLTTATGIFTGRNATDDGLERQQYTLAMEYDNLHNITSKQQLHQSAPGDTGGTWTDIPATTYSLDYEDDTNDGYGTADFNIAGYEYNQPHAPRKIIDKPYAVSPDSYKKTKVYDYDANGNLTDITQTTGESEAVEKLRTNLWDEENRLRAVDITPDAEGVRPIAIYTYDAGGERILKHSNTSVSIYLNGKKVADEIQTDATLYPSGMLVARVIPGEEEESPATLGYTKHYYAGTQRVSSKIGTTENLGNFLQDWFTQGTGGPVDVVGSSNDVIVNAQVGVTQVYDELGIDPPTFDSDPVFIPVQSFTHGDAEIEQYWFHPDHLGSSNYITNLAGEVSQHMEYFAFGETFVEEHKSSNNSPYKFNGKELDEETGWYYYGARYYDARTSVWLSVDPLAEKYPGWSPYNYTLQNPVRFIDPNGKGPTDIIYLDADGKVIRVELDGKAHITIIDPENEGKSLSLSSYYTNRGPIHWNNRSRKIIANIASYYGKQIGVSGMGSTYKGDGEIAYHDSSDNGIWIATQENGRVDPSLNDKYALQNVLFHENLHKSGKYENTFIGHSEVYLEQMSHETFLKSPEEFQLGQVGSFANHLMNARTNKEEGVDSMIEEFNNLNTGYEININNSGGGLEATIINTKNNDAYSVPYDKLNSPSD